MLKRLPEIDALRGWAVLGVIAAHSGQAVPEYSSVLSFGSRGVQLFFVVSAITLMMSWDARRQPKWAFFLRRIFRIAPMFWFALLYYAIERGDHPTQLAIATTASLLFAATPWTVNSLIPGGWSVGFEFMFYLCFPFIASRIRSFPALLSAFLISLAVGQIVHLCVTKFVFPQGSDPVWREQISLWLQLPVNFSVFFAGIACYFSTKRFEAIPRRYLELILIACIVQIAWVFQFENASIGLCGVLFSVVAFCLIKGAGRYLSSAAMRWIGKVSFSAYLIHFALIDFAWSLTGHLLQPGLAALFFNFMVLAAATVTLSSVSYTLIEKPMSRVGEWIISCIANILTHKSRERLIFSKMVSP